MRVRPLLLLSLVCSYSCFAAETVYLTSGFSMIVDSHTEQDGVCVLHIGTGTIEYPSAEISKISPGPVAARAEAKPPDSPAKPEALLTEASRNEGVDALFVRSVAKVESGLRQQAVSNKGALGLMQLMPGTAAELGVDPTQAEQNASGGVRYLRSLLERYHYNPVLALAAYNAGPGAVTKYNGLPPYYETRAYVVRVLKEYEKELKQAGLQPDGTPVQNAPQMSAAQSPRTASAIN